jgi:hypothetical protein
MGVSWIDIVVPIVVGILIILVSIYLFTIYCHRTPALTQPKKRASAMPSSPRHSSSCPRPSPGVRYSSCPSTSA